MQRLGRFTKSVQHALSPSDSLYFINNSHLRGLPFSTLGNFQRHYLSTNIIKIGQPSQRTFNKALRHFGSKSNFQKTLGDWNGVRPILPRFFSSNAALQASITGSLPVLASPSVARWLLLSSALVFGVIVVGGVTRLTESGLSITEWRPITGVLPPLGQEQWEMEFTKYKETPEYKMCVIAHSHISSLMLMMIWIR